MIACYNVFKYYLEASSNDPKSNKWKLKDDIIITGDHLIQVLILNIYLVHASII